MSQVTLDLNGSLNSLITGANDNIFGVSNVTTLTQPGNKSTEGLTGNAYSSAQPTLAAPSFDAHTLGQILLTLKTKLGEQQIQTSTADIQTNKDRTAEKHREVIEKIEEAIDSMEKAKKGGVFQKVFGWAGVIITAIAAVGLMVATGGAAAPIAGMMLLIAVDQAVGMTTGHSAMGELTNVLAKGFTEVLAPFIGREKAELVGQIMAAVVVAVVVIAATMGAGSLSAAAIAASSTAKVIHAASLISMGVTQIGSGTASMVTASFEKDAADSQADKMDIQKILAKLQARMEQDTERLRELMELLSESVSTVLAMLDTENRTIDKITQNTV